jgi:MFS superfamily sulfate permease-like transporter
MKVAIMQGKGEDKSTTVQPGQSGHAQHQATQSRAPHGRSMPLDRLPGLKENWRSDIVSGFILFLIALPLSLGIAMASGVPPMAGLIAAIVGGMLVSQINGSYVTINGPAAGLIVVILGSVDRLGGGLTGYHCALAAILVSGLALTISGFLRCGKLGDLAPSSVVHGMLAAIGLIIMIKQIPVLLGVPAPAKEPFQLLAKLPEMLAHLNPEITLIGVVSLVVLVGHNMLKGGLAKKIPAPILVVAIALAMGMWFHLDQAHDYSFNAIIYHIKPEKMLVVLPQNLSSAIVMPDFSKALTGAFWFSVLSITLVQGIESLLSCAAVDKLDPYQRKSNLSKDVSGVGMGTMVSGFLGGLPMIAEIVRSTANVMNGAKTRWSNFFHGMFILAFLVVGANLIDRIPLTALAALLMVVGYKLCAPAVWKKTHEVGVEQTLLFTVTVITTVATDLLIGVATGIACKFVLHLINGAPITNLFKADVQVEQKDAQTYYVTVKPVAVFSNYLSIKGKLQALPPRAIVTLDLEGVKLIDHTVMDHLHEVQHDYNNGGGRFEIVGLERLTPASKHPMSARKLKSA